MATKKRTIKSYKDEIRQLKKDNRRLIQSNAWYSTGNEKLSLLRYYIYFLMEAIDGHNRFCKSANSLNGRDDTDQCPIRLHKMPDAIKAVEDVEKFFTKTDYKCEFTNLIAK